MMQVEEGEEGSDGLPLFYDDPAMNDDPPPAMPAEAVPSASIGGASGEPAAVKTLPVREDVVVPELRAWEWAEHGGIRAHVHGQDGLRPGQKLATSRIVEVSPVLEETEEALEQSAGVAAARLHHFHVLTAESAATLCQGALVVTRSLTTYRLGAPRSAAVPPQAAAAPDAAQLPVRAVPAAPALRPPHVSRLGERLPRATEVEGYQLKLSPSNNSGYMHVDARSNGTFDVQFTLKDGCEIKNFKARGFETDVDAALGCAKHTAGEDPPMPNGEKFRMGGQDSAAPHPPAVAWTTATAGGQEATLEAAAGGAAAAAVAAIQRGGGSQLVGVAAATTPPVVVCADRVRLR